MRRFNQYKGLFWLILAITSLLWACSPEKTNLSSAEAALVKDSVTRMTTHIARDITQKGPIAWLSYFEDCPQFFMASDGQMVFPNHPAAELFIKNTLVKIMPKISLSWSNLKVDPLTAEFAQVAAEFHEDITDAGGKTATWKGYFTAMAQKTAHGWQLRNAHWSIQKAK